MKNICAWTREINKEEFNQAMIVAVDNELKRQGIPLKVMWPGTTKGFRPTYSSVGGRYRVTRL